MIENTIVNKEDLMNQFIKILGDDAVLTSEEEIQEFRDPYAIKGSKDYQPSFVVQPSTVEEVQAVVKLANDLGIHLWTSSMGRNYGYGGSAPVVNESIVLNLRRMNKILEINEEDGYVLVEPGVRFFDLYNELKARGSKLLMSVPDLGWGSIIGNALEHGYGYTINGDNAASVCGMEVVLPTGEVIRTGQGANTKSPMWQRHKRGFGPSIDSLFMQSNFGVVTKMGVWLQPQPEVMSAGIVLYDGEDIVKLVDIIRPLVLDGTIQGYPLLISAPRLDEVGDHRLELFKRARQSGFMPPFRWAVRISLFGYESMVKAREDIIRKAISNLPGAVLDIETYPGNVGPEDVRPEHLVASGIPNMLMLEQLKESFGENVGHSFFPLSFHLRGMHSYSMTIWSKRF